MAYAPEEHIHNETLREDVYLRRHSCGLPVYFCPKPGFSKRYACFATHFGSIDLRFRPRGSDVVQVPDGIAHFLEHKLFEGEDCNAFDKFSRFGASSNAYTSFNVTNYLFSCASSFFENLDLLVNFVLDPYFTDDNVEKEKGIIGQEIRMYDDDPGWQVYMNLMRGLYHKYPVNVDIAGTVESIAAIDKESLFACYRAFYQPRNMILFVVGDEERERVFAAVDGLLTRRTFPEWKPIERLYPEEPRAIARASTAVDMVVSMPRILVGFKDHDVGYGGRRLLKKELVTDLVLEILFGKASAFYQRLYEEKLLDDSFSVSFSSQMGIGHSLLGGETPDPERLAREIIAEAERAGRAGIAGEDFERQKRAVMGSFLRHFNSLEFIANNYSTYRFYDIDLFDMIDVLHGVTLADLDGRLREHLAPASAAISIVRPRGTLSKSSQ